jgi:amicyanin
MLMACLALGLVAVGCGDDDDDEGNGGSAQTTEQTDTTEEETTEDSGGGGDSAEVGMQNIQFDPSELTVAAGTTVTWTNNEDVPHDVTKESGPGEDFSSGQGNMQNGDTFEHTFEDAGTYEYVCTVHPNMTGSVTVE